MEATLQGPMRPEKTGLGGFTHLGCLANFLTICRIWDVGSNPFYQKKMFRLLHWVNIWLMMVNDHLVAG